MLANLLTGGVLKALYEVACLAYSRVLRELVKELIDDPTSQVDEVILGILDKLFDYEE